MKILRALPGILLIGALSAYAQSPVFNPQEELTEQPKATNTSRQLVPDRSTQIDTLYIKKAEQPDPIPQSQPDTEPLITTRKIEQPITTQSNPQPSEEIKAQPIPITQAIQPPPIPRTFGKGAQPSKIDIQSNRLYSTAYSLVLPPNPAIASSYEDFFNQPSVAASHNIIAIDQVNKSGVFAYDAFSGTLFGKIESRGFDTKSNSRGLSETTTTQAQLSLGYAGIKNTWGAGIVLSPNLFIEKDYNPEVSRETQESSNIGLFFDFTIGANILYVKSDWITNYYTTTTESADPSITNDQINGLVGFLISSERSSIDVNLAIQSQTKERTADGETKKLIDVDNFPEYYQITLNGGYGKIVRSSSALRAYAGMNGSIGFRKYADVEGTVKDLTFTTIILTPNGGLDYIVNKYLTFFGGLSINIVSTTRTHSGTGAESSPVSSNIGDESLTQTGINEKGYEVGVEQSGATAGTGFRIDYDRFTLEAAIGNEFFDKGFSAIMNGDMFSSATVQFRL